MPWTPSGDSQFNVAQGLVLDGQGNLYAGDIFGPVTRIQRLTLVAS